MRIRQSLWMGGALAAGTSLLGMIGYRVRRLFEPRPSPPPPPAATREGRWRQDVEYLARELPRLHANISHTISCGEFEGALRDLVDETPHLEDHQIRARIAQTVARIGDAHTEVGGVDGDQIFPVAPRWFGDRLFITRSAPEYTQLLGCELVQIGDTPIREAFARVSTLISHENDQRLRLISPWYLVNSDVLLALGILSARGEGMFTVRTPADVALRLRLPTVDAEQTDRWVPAVPKVPLYLQRREEPFWLVHLAAERVLYVKYNVCSGIFPVWRFARQVHRVLSRCEVRTLVVDFRGNPGGNSSPFTYLLLPQLAGAAIRSQARLYAVIDRATFSSAMLNAAQMRRYADALVIGEPSSGKPNCYGEVRQLTLPNSGMPVWYATKYIESYPELGDAPSFEPDVHVEVSPELWFAGRDPVLETIPDAPPTLRSSRVVMREPGS